jgi:hypothetical protein
MTSKAAAPGKLPEWNLADLYPSPASPEFAADLKRGEAEAKTFAEQYRGKLATLPGEELAKAVGAGGSRRDRGAFGCHGHPPRRYLSKARPRLFRPHRIARTVLLRSWRYPFV